MILSLEQINRNIDWLLRNGSPPVKYLTHFHLLQTPPDAPEMAQLWKEVEDWKEVKEIFSKQEKDGSWCSGGSWATKPSYQLKDGWDPYTPKYVTTVWVLPLLGEMGFSIRDERIRKACDYVLGNGYFRDPVFHKAEVTSLREASISPCRFAQYLIGLSAVGLTVDPRVKLGYDFLMQLQRPDGGWALEQHIQERNWTRSCPFSTYHAAMALYEARDEARTSVYQGALNRALEFLAGHLASKDEAEIRRFFYHGHSTVRELLMFSEYGIGLKQRAVQVILEWLMSMYRADEGHFSYGGKPISQYSNRQDGMDSRVAKYRLYHLVEDDWLTYHLTRVGMNLRQNRGGNLLKECGQKN